MGPVIACLFLTGASEKCIQNEAGDWFTPKEFLIEGERARSKDWKKTIRCKAKTLRFLEKVL